MTNPYQTDWPAGEVAAYTPGQTLDPNQVAAAAYAAGWTDPQDLATITQIAENESSGQTGVIGIGTNDPSPSNPNTRNDQEYSLGLTQINVAPGANPTQGQQFGSTLLLPVSNFLAAREMFQASNFGPWQYDATFGASHDVNSPIISPAVQAAATWAVDNPAQAKQVARQVQNAAANAEAAHPGSLPPSWTGSVPASVAGNDGLPGTGMPSTLQSVATTAGSAGTPSNPTPGIAYNAGLHGNAFGVILIAVDGWLNPVKPTSGGNFLIGMLVPDLMWELRMIGTRLAFALPGLALVLAALGSSLLGIAKDVLVPKALAKR